MKTMLILLVLVLGGCGIDQQEINECQMRCGPNGGIKKIAVDGGCICNNGAKFQPPRN